MATPTPDERIDKLETALDFEKRFVQLNVRMAALEKDPRDNNLLALGPVKIRFGPRVIVTLLILLAALVFFLWLAPSERVSFLVGLFHVNEKGNLVQEDSEISSVYTLVTPHEKTLEDLEAKGVVLSEEEKKYYKLDNNALEGFAKQIKEEGAQGYTRREVWGEGSKPSKRGWEWTINWKKERAIKLGRLLEIYEKYFYRSKGIYIEERRVGKTVFDRK